MNKLLSLAYTYFIAYFIATNYSNGVAHALGTLSMFV